MNDRIFNFSSGPAVMPVPVLERAREELLAAGGAGMSVMEMSHRSKEFGVYLERAERGLRELLSVPDEFHVLFMPGGATLQFTLVPINLLAPNAKAGFIVTGAWGEKAIREASRSGSVESIYDHGPNGFRSIPASGSVKIDPSLSYVHYTSNETIDGVEFSYDFDGNGVPVVCDASSNILSKPIDIQKYDLIYAGAQKNIGPSGVTVVIVRKALLERYTPDIPPIFDYRNFAKHASMPNTPNTWAIYMIGLVCDWLKEMGGVAAMEKINIRKAEKLYAALDSSDGFYIPRVDRDARSRMNVTFELQDKALEKVFCSEAEKQGMSGLRGHRSAGGIRASIYNAFPEEGVATLIDYMHDFASRHG